MILEIGVHLVHSNSVLSVVATDKHEAQKQGATGDIYSAYALW